VAGAFWRVKGTIESERLTKFRLKLNHSGAIPGGPNEGSLARSAWNAGK